MEIQLNFKKVDGNQTNLDGNQTNLDGNWTNLDGIPTNHRKQQFFNFHILPMRHALFLWELGDLSKDINFDSSLSQAIDHCQTYIQKNMHPNPEMGVWWSSVDSVIVSPSGDLGIGLVWDKPTGPDRTEPLFSPTVEILFKLNWIIYDGSSAGF